MKIRKLALVLVFAMLLTLMGCGPKEPSQEFQAVVEELSEVYLALDADGKRFDQTLKTVGRYLDGKVSQEEAALELEEDLEYFGSELEDTKEYTLSKSLSADLKACGISAQDFIAFGNSRSSELYDQKLRTEYFLEYLITAEEFQESYENLQFYHEHYQALQDCLRGYYYYGGINGWFAEAEDYEIAYVRETLISEIHCYLPEDPQWADSEDGAEDLAEEYLDEIDKILTVLSEHVGQSQQDLYDMERVYQKLAVLIEALLKEDLSVEPLYSISGQVQTISDAFSTAVLEEDMEMILTLEVQIDRLQAEFDAAMENKEE